MSFSQLASKYIVMTACFSIPKYEKDSSNNAHKMFHKRILYIAIKCCLVVITKMSNFNTHNYIFYAYQQLHTARFCDRIKLTVCWEKNRTAYSEEALMPISPAAAFAAFLLTSNNPARPRSHIYGSWFPLVHVNAPSGSWPTTRLCQSSAAKRADVAPGRKWSVEPAKKGHRCGRMHPSSTASD